MNRRKPAAEHYPLRTPKKQLCVCFFSRWDGRPRMGSHLMFPLLKTGSVQVLGPQAATALVFFLPATNVKGQASSLEGFSFQEDLPGGQAGRRVGGWLCMGHRSRSCSLWSHLESSKKTLLGNIIFSFGLRKPVVVVIVDSRKGATSFFFSSFRK